MILANQYIPQSHLSILFYMNLYSKDIIGYQNLLKLISTSYMNSKKDYYKNILTPEQYKITREGETESPYTGKYCNIFDKGTYLCICCDTPLFSSHAKYESGSGWPDFSESIKKGVIKYTEELNHGVKQIEVKCNNCNAHLGHVFNDGPPPNYKRY